MSHEDHVLQDHGELQNVLTRYVDSYEGYLEAAKIVDSANYASAFEEIATRRKEIVSVVSTLIDRQGVKSEATGSPEAVLHRWWMQFRAAMTDEEFKATLAECIRGEKELSRTLKSSLQAGDLRSDHVHIISAASKEVDEAIVTFQTAIDG